jgi:TolB-like protein/class 3 adenylate cyclase/thioredoxin-like negative regulator of GroEL
MERRLAAILSADVVGYSRLMGEDEVGTLARLKSYRRELVDPSIAQFHGRIIKLMGDGALVEFASVVDAVQCAVEIQRRVSDRESGTSAGRIQFRIGVNLGDIIVEESDIYGDGVNIAARLEAMAEPGGICISGTAFDQVAHKVDAGFAALGEQRLKNIVDPVRVYRVLLDPGSSGRILAASRRPGLRVLIAAGVVATLSIAALADWLLWQNVLTPKHPSVAVLPFANESGDPSQDYFVDGITEDLITDLAKVSGLDVVARNSVFAYKNRPDGPAEVARALGVRYVVEGSVRRSGDRIRISARLVDTATGKDVWADRFDRGLAGVFDIQDELGRKIAGALDINPSAAESERMARPPTTNLEAYDYYLRAEQAARTGERSGLREALGLFDRAEAIDPNFAEAFAADARTTVYIWRASFHEIIQSALARKRAYEKAGRALELDRDLSSPYAVLGIMQVVDRRYEEAVASAKRGVALDPGDAGAQMALAYVQLFAGNHAAAAAEAALRLDPNMPAPDREIAGLVFLVQGDTTKAIGTLERTCADAPSVGNYRFTLAAAYVRAGRLPEAQAAVAEGLRLVADALAGWRSLSAWRIGDAHFRNADDLALILEALKAAGLPEWPFGFTADAQEQLKGEEIAALVVGHTLQGRLEPSSQPAILQIGEDGQAAFRSRTRLVTETVYVERNLLCERSENMFGRPDCGPVYRTDNAYTYVNSSKVFHFEVIDQSQ